MVDRVGQQLGNYRLLRLLGQGGLASVYLGEHLYLKSQAALKVRHTVLTEEEQTVFLQEAQTLVRLSHPHIVRVLDFALQDGMPFLVMEYAPHGTLRQRHPKGSKLPLDLILPYIQQVASALQYTHDQRLIHRDVKPENLLLSSHDQVLLSDFGLVMHAPQTLASGSTELMEPLLAGTTPYLAPEQVRGKAQPASDQYALGVAIYEWLCGKPPFQGPFLEVAMQHVSAPPPSLREQVPDLSPAIEEVVLRALAKEPEQRFTRVQDFATTLAYASQQAVSPRLTPVLAPKHGVETGQRPPSMPNLPRGTVTLLFTDIEGSTRLLQCLGERYPDVLAECRGLLRAAFHQHHGHEADTQGDAFSVAFTRATDAISAAVDAQRALASHPWPEGAAVRVRMGLHTGEPSLTSEGYVGLDVHRAAHIMSAGHGGQVLLSQTTRDLVEHALPEGAHLQDLGAHHLKDLQQQPSHLFQVVIAGLPIDFPPLRTLDTQPNNLPIQPTPFIGREKEVAAVTALLRREDVRLLTLTGPGGTGKTRLGVQVAAELSEVIADGVFFVNLAPISDPSLVVPTIAQTLDVREAAGQPLLDLVSTFLREQQVLLLLDNFEQVASAALEVADLLTVCPRLKVLVTSREVLHVRAEREFAVPVLTVPDPKHLPDLVALSQYEAVALFISRAQAVKPEFQVSTTNARAVAEICARLDGLPLAVELAAARIKLLPPQALLARLGQRLAILTSVSRDVPTRQQTLRNTIAWSYHLLEVQEQRLFRQLSVFAGGCTLEAIEAVCTALPDGAGQVFDGVASLLDKSLLQQIEQEGEEPRLTMLETVREYGLESLHESGEAHESQRAHALYYLAFAEEAEPHLKEVQQVLWWRQLEQEQENLRTALAWLIGQEEGELALCLSGALWRFWMIRGYWSEGWRWLEAALGLPQTQGRTARRATALYGAGELAHRLGQPVARSLLEESVSIYRELGDKRGLTESLGEFGSILSAQNDLAAARTLLEEGLVLAREVGDSWLLANALRKVGEFMSYHHDFKSARLYLEESVALYRELKDQHALSSTLHELTEVTVFDGKVALAATLALESLALARELDNGPDITRALYWLAFIRSMQGDAEQAVVLHEESLALAREQGDKSQVGITLFTLGSIALDRGDLLQAETYTQDSLTLFRELRDKHKTALALSLVGDIRRRQGDLTQAREICKEAVLLALEAGNPYSQGWSLISLARVAADGGQPEQAARLFGAAEPWLNPSVEMDPEDRTDYDRAVERVRSQLDEKAFATAWAEGRGMTPEQALATQTPKVESISGGASSAPSAKLPTTSLDGLSARELEVLRLLATGLTDAQIAEQLVLSLHTIHAHLRTIYSKLGVTSRSAATRYAFEHQLM